MKIVVLKFGGTSVGTIKKIKKVVEIISTKKVLTGVVEKTIKFNQKLNKLSEKYNLFKDVRSAGLWICCDFKKIKSVDLRPPEPMRRISEESKSMKTRNLK